MKTPVTTVTSGSSKWQGFLGTGMSASKHSPPCESCWFILESRLKVAKSIYKPGWFYKRALETWEAKLGGLATVTLTFTIISMIAKTCAQFSVAAGFTSLLAPAPNSSSF